MASYHGLQIANVVPEQEDNVARRCHVSESKEVAVYCTRTEWEQVLQSCEHAKECGWPAFMVQKAQDTHEHMTFFRLQNRSPPTISSA